jgi:ABC-type nitrate/sulfonate/bicarbonate transport system substrate-binding protein
MLDSAGTACGQCPIVSRHASLALDPAGQEACMSERPFSARLAIGPGAILLVLAGCLAAAPSYAAEPVAVRVNGFPNAKVLPLWVGLEQSIFSQQGLRLELQLTDNSRSQREGLAAGKFDIAQAALDNAVAMIEVAKEDVVIVSGGDSGMNEFFVQPEIGSFADLRGRVIIVDAPDTAYALQAKKILAQHGLRAPADYTVKPVGAGVFRLRAMAESKDNAAAILNLPFTVEAEQMGLRSLGRTIDLLGPYQAAGAFVMRRFARENGPTLERYLAAYVQSLRWLREPSHRPPCVALLMDKLGLTKETAERTYTLLVDPAFGFTPDAEFDFRGFRNMLALRAEMQSEGRGTPASLEHYVDLSYYERAVQGLGR